MMITVLESSVKALEEQVSLLKEINELKDDRITMLNTYIQKLESILESNSAGKLNIPPYHLTGIKST